MGSMKVGLTVNFMENAARAFARNKAEDVSGELVDIALNGTEATIPSLDLIQRAELQMKRRVEALLKHALVEFTGMWTKELERVAEASRAIAADAIALQKSPVIELLRGNLNQAVPTEQEKK